MNRVVIFGFFIFAMSMYAGGAGAQQKSTKKAIPKDTSTVALPDSVFKKIYLEPIEVKGWIEKPLAIYIIPGSDPRVDDIRIDRSFMEEILKPLDKDTFERERKKPPVIIPW